MLALRVQWIVAKRWRVASCLLLRRQSFDSGRTLLQHRNRSRTTGVLYYMVSQSFDPAALIVVMLFSMSD
jgi:hypothetical protein